MPLLESRLLLGSLVGMVGLCACGGVSSVDHPGFGNETAGSSSEGANGAGRGGDEVAGSGSGGNSASGGSGVAGASSCSQFRDDSPQTVTVTLRNDTSKPVYIGSRMQTCGATPLYEVRDASNAVVAERGACGSPCGSWLDGNPVGGCVAICQLSSVTKLDAGETIVTDWAGLSELDVHLPTACNGSRLSGTVECSVDKRIVPGRYAFRSAAGSAFVCDGSPNGCEACVPAATGGCTVSGATVSGTEIVAALDVDLDPSFGIGAGGAGNAGQNRRVELVFKLLP